MNNLSRDEDPKGEATRANNVLRQKFKTYIRQKGFAGTAVFFRGSKTGLDPTYACMAHDGQPRRYGMIVIDGGEGGTGAGPIEFLDHMGTPLTEGLLFAHNVLVGTGLRDKIKLGCSAKIVTAFGIASKMAIGADWCNAARGFMFAVGCIQAQRCHTNTCPVGVATQDPHRQKGLVVPDKAERVYNFHRNTLDALSQVVAATGLEHPNQFEPLHVARRVSPTTVLTYEDIYDFLEPGELLEGTPNPLYGKYWNRADMTQFCRPGHA